MKFTIKKVGGGFHPVIDVKLNGRKVKALIDTGANITCSDFEINGTVIIGKHIFKGTIKGYKLPNNYELIIGSDILVKTGAIINYRNNTIVFK